MKYNYKKRWLVEKKLRGLQENLKRILIDNSSLTSRVTENKNPIKLISSRTYLTKQKDKSSKKYSLVREVKIQGYLDNDEIARSTIPIHQAIILASNGFINLLPLIAWERTIWSSNMPSISSKLLSM